MYEFIEGVFGRETAFYVAVIVLAIFVGSIIYGRVTRHHARKGLQGDDFFVRTPTENAQVGQLEATRPATQSDAIVECGSCGMVIPGSAVRCPYCGKATRRDEATASRRLVATLMSLMVPGAGLFVRGRVKTGLIVLLGATTSLLLGLLVMGITPVDSVASDLAFLVGGGAAVGLWVWGIVASVKRSVGGPPAV